LNSKTETVPSINNAEIDVDESFDIYKSIGFDFVVTCLIKQGGVYAKSYTRIN